MTNRTTEFNILSWNYNVLDDDEVLVYVDVAYKNARHRVSFYGMIDDKNNIEEELNECMEQVNKGFYDDLFYEQLESDHVDTQVYGPYIGKTEVLNDVPTPTLEAWNNLLPIERNAYREKNRLHNLGGNYGRKMDKEYISYLNR